MMLKKLHYGWIMVIIATFVLATHSFVLFGFGVFLRPVATEFGWERGALSGAFSLSMLFSGIFALITGRLSDKYGPRILVTISGISVGVGFILFAQVNSLWQTYLIWAVFMGVGGSCAFIPLTSTLPRWFAERTGMALGITVAGFGTGGIITPPLTQWLISSFGWQQA
ncbi:MAG: MFS transporter, partial [Dehalococcoidales bacterium]|nr:MFS transporter [Dehalococcoidales bacterium]